jgi:hypothetical protein
VDREPNAVRETKSLVNDEAFAFLSRFISTFYGNDFGKGLAGFFKIFASHLCRNSCGACASLGERQAPLPSEDLPHGQMTQVTRP